MALKINFENKGGAAGPLVTADRRLYLTAARDRVVEEGDPDARILYCVAGQRLPAAEAKARGAKFATDDADADADDVDVLDGRVKDVVPRIAEISDAVELDRLEAAEGDRNKPRKGVLDAIDAARDAIEGG